MEELPTKGGLYHYHQHLGFSSFTTVIYCFVLDFINVHGFFLRFEDTHRLYKQKLEEVTKLQNSCASAISRQRKKLEELAASVRA